jgi:hypothetical protein
MQEKREEKGKDIIFITGQCAVFPGIRAKQSFHSGKHFLKQSWYQPIILAKNRLKPATSLSRTYGLRKVFTLFIYAIVPGNVII